MPGLKLNQVGSVNRNEDKAWVNDYIVTLHLDYLLIHGRIKVKQC